MELKLDRMEDRSSRMEPLTNAGEQLRRLSWEMCAIRSKDCDTRSS